MAKTLIYIDTFAVGSAHEMFNTSLLIMCAETFEQVQCYTSRSAYHAMQNILDHHIPKNVTYSPLPILNGSGRFCLLWRYLAGTLLNAWYILTAPKGSHFILPFNNVFSLKIINTINKIRKHKIIIFCHGEMEGLISDKMKAGLLSQLIIQLSRLFFLNKRTRIAPNLFFAVIGNKIKSNLVSYLSPEIAQHFISVDHPYIFKTSLSPTSTSKTKLYIGTVGALSPTKGMHQFITFVKKLPASLRSFLDISVTGRIFGDVSSLLKLNVDIPDTTEPLSREEFDKRIHSLDYILYFYSPDSYKVTASGALMDAIYHQKPIIALRTDYFEYFFARFGQIGYLCNTIEQMIDILIHLIEHPDTALKPDFKTIQTQLSPYSMVSQFQNELAQIKF